MYGILRESRVREEEVSRTLLIFMSVNLLEHGKVGRGRPEVDSWRPSRCYQRQQLALVCLNNTLIGRVVYSNIRWRYRSEKDASGWSKDKIKGLLLGLEFEGPEGMAVRGTYFCSTNKYWYEYRKMPNYWDGEVQRRGYSQVRTCVVVGVDMLQYLCEEPHELILDTYNYYVPVTRKPQGLLN